MVTAPGCPVRAPSDNAAHRTGGRKGLLPRVARKLQWRIDLAVQQQYGQSDGVARQAVTQLLLLHGPRIRCIRGQRRVRPGCGYRPDALVPCGCRHDGFRQIDRVIVDSRRMSGRKGCGRGVCADTRSRRVQEGVKDVDCSAHQVRLGCASVPQVLRRSRSRVRFECESRCVGTTFG
jgi:hypothetical protein